MRTIIIAAVLALTALACSNQESPQVPALRGSGATTGNKQIMSRDGPAKA